MSDDPSTWWSHTTEQSVKLVLEYMPVKPRAVVASTLSVRAWSELEDLMENCAKKDTDNSKYRQIMVDPLRFIKDEMHPEYPLCTIDMRDIKQIKRLLWWLQRTQPRAVELRDSQMLLANELEQLLRLIFNDAALLSDSMPLSSNLLEFSIAAIKDYTCGTILKTLGQCLSLQKLRLRGCRSLRSLEGLEKFVHLEELDLSFTSVSDLTWLRHCTPLACLRTLKFVCCKDLATTAGIENLTNVEHIDVSHSGVAHVAGLKHCTALRAVIATGCERLLDFDELEGLSYLETLKLGGTKVEAISFLRDAARLVTLDLTWTRVQDLTSLQNCRLLRVVSFNDCKNVKSIEALKGMVALEELDLCGTSVEDIEPLAASTRLRVLNLNGCQHVKNTAILKNMHHLEELDLSNTLVGDLAPLAECVQLKKLSLRDYTEGRPLMGRGDVVVPTPSVHDLIVVAGYAQMKELDLKGCKGVRDLALLAGLTALEILCLSFTSVTDITPLAGCVHMQKLYLECCKGVQNLVSLAGMTALQVLNVSKTSVEDLTPLTHCLQLKMLRLDHCRRVRSVAALASLSKLEFLSLSGTRVKDINPLANSPQLQTLYLQSCVRLRDVCVLQNLPQLKGVYFSQNMQGKVITTGLSEEKLECFKFC